MNITGFLNCSRGSSFLNAAVTASVTIAGSQIDIRLRSLSFGETSSESAGGGRFVRVQPWSKSLQLPMPNYQLRTLDSVFGTWELEVGS
jgi:hypothetical protein